jgi:hypothetical protein
MTDDQKNTGSPKSYGAYAGVVQFPRTPADLTSTTNCPACFSVLRSSVCDVCGLDLGHPAAGELATVSRDAAALLDQRLDYIGLIRYDTEVAHQTTAQPAPPAPVPTPASAPFPVLGPPPSYPASPPAAASAAPRASARSSVQVILLLVGVALLSIGTIFFLVYAFITYGILVRSLIIGAVTVAAFVVASILRRRTLRGTAEGIAAFATVLIYLDAYAIRANNLFGAQGAGGELYWGSALVVSSLGFIVWHRLSKLRVPSIVGFAAIAPGVGLVAGGIGDKLPGSSQAFLVFSVVAIAALIHVVSGRSAERFIVLVIADAAMLAAFATAFFLDYSSRGAPAVALALVVAIGALHVFAASRVPRSRAVTVPVAVIVAIASLAATTAAVTVPARAGDFSSFVLWPPLIAAPLALLLEVAARRTSTTYFKVVTRTGAIATGVVATLLLIAPLVFAIGTAVTAAVEGVTHSWGLSLLGSVNRHDLDETHSLAVLAAIGVFAAVLWAVIGVAGARRGILFWAAGGVILLAAPLLDARLVVTLAWIVLGIAAISARILLRGRGGRALGRALVGVAGVATALGYFASWATIDSWAYGTIGAIVVLSAARFALPPVASIARASVLAPGVIVVLVGSAALVRQLAGFPPADATSAVDGLHAVAAMSIVGIVLAVALKPLAVADRRVLFWMSLPIAILSAISARVVVEASATSAHYFLALPTTSLVLAVALLAALVIAIVVRPAPDLQIERITASVLIAPAVLWIVDSILHAVDAPQFIVSLEPFGSTVIVAALTLVLTLFRPFAVTRLAIEVGVVVVAIPSLAFVLAVHPPSAWLALVLLGVTSLLLAVDRDGLFGSASPRRFLGWPALALMTIGLWWRLGGDNVTAIEPYVLPLAGALLVVAILVWRSVPTDKRTVQLTAPIITLAALLVAIVPIALTSATGTVARPISVGLVSLALLAAGAFLRAGGLRSYLDVAAISGALGVAIVGFGRAVAHLVENGPAGATLDGWLVATLAVLVIAALGVVRTPGRVRNIIAQSGVIVVLAGVTLLECQAFADPAYGLARGIAVVVLLSAIYLASLLLAQSPFTPVVGWVALALAAIAGIVGIADDAIRPIELASVPIALALIAAGALHLADRPAARSWPHLGPGILILLLPPLVATATDRPLWRLVALGVVAVGILVIGVVARLQAPFLLASVVVLIHGIATFSMQIRLVYQSVEWWLWLVIGGVVLIVLAARYEQRIRNLRSAVGRIGALR